VHWCNYASCAAALLCTNASWTHLWESAHHGDQLWLQLVQYCGTGLRVSLVKGIPCHRVWICHGTEPVLCLQGYNLSVGIGYRLLIGIYLLRETKKSNWSSGLKKMFVILRLQHKENQANERETPLITLSAHVTIQFALLDLVHMPLLQLCYVLGLVLFTNLTLEFLNLS
jgi:hypothetical protein